jgi:foldase protein PrsA
MIGAVAPRTRRSVVLLAAAVAMLVTSAPAASHDAHAEPRVPHGAVVLVGDATLSRVLFKRWFAIAVRGSPGAGRSIRGYDPPSFEPCILRLRKQERRPPGTPGRSSKARLKQRCRDQYEGVRDQVLQFLILERWVSNEARELGVQPTQRQLDAEFEEAREQTFSSEADWKRFLRQAGMTVADARFQVAFNTRYTMLREHAIASAPPVTAAEVRASYDADPASFERPATRDVRVVLTRTRARALAARAALERGQTWRHVARTYSIDVASRGRGGLLRGVTRDSFDDVMGRAVLRAPRGRLRGPIGSPVGFYVFEVVAITPARRRTFEQVAAEIREQLELVRAREADESFNEGLRAKWRARTWCRAGFVMDQCANAPDPDHGIEPAP